MGGGGGGVLAVVFPPSLYKSVLALKIVTIGNDFEHLDEKNGCGWGGGVGEGKRLLRHLLHICVAFLL